jgi:hypothetical protein
MSACFFICGGNDKKGLSTSGTNNGGMHSDTGRVRHTQREGQYFTRLHYVDSTPLFRELNIYCPIRIRGPTRELIKSESQGNT